MSRGPVEGHPSPGSNLPEDLRTFDDYACYVSSALSLWVWSLQGLEQQREWEDPNRGHLIYANQVVCEMLDYGCMLQRSLADIADSLAGTRDVLAARRYVADLPLQMHESSLHGEVRTLLEHGWHEMGMERLRSRVSEALAVRDEQASIAESNRRDRVGTALTVFFGMMAVPAVSEGILTPIWKWRQWPRPPDDDAFACLLLAVALGFTAAAIGCVFALKRGATEE